MWELRVVNQAAGVLAFHEQLGRISHLTSIKKCKCLTFFDTLLGMTTGDVSMGMNVNLTPQLEELVRAKVNSGMYTSASEVVREALRLMDEQDRLKQIKLDDLRRDVRRGIESGDSERWDATAVKTKARTARAAKLAAA